MYALILQSQERVEVLGFVHYGGALRAVYRDDEGNVSDIDVSGIRMLPNTEARQEEGLRRLHQHLNVRRQPGGDGPATAMPVGVR